MKREDMSESDLYFAMRVINQMRPSLDAGTFSPDLAHLLILSEEQVESGCAVLRTRFNLDEKQQDMMTFIQYVLNLHRHNMDYKAVWDDFDNPDGMIVMHIMIDDYENRDGWEYSILHSGNIQIADIDEDYRNHLIELMAINSRDVMLVCFVDRTRSELHGSNFLMEIWHLLPTLELTEQTKRMANYCSEVFSLVQKKPYELKHHSELVMQLVMFDRPEILRAALEHYSLRKPLQPYELDWNQFVLKIWDVLTKMMNEAFPQAIMADQKDNQTTMMWFRFLDSPKAAEFHHTYGPITKLTIPIVKAFLEELRTSDESENRDYEMSMYERHLRTLTENDDGGLHFFFTHEQWMHQHQCPFVCLWKVPEAVYQQENDVLEIIKSILGIHDPVSMASEDRAIASRSEEFFPNTRRPLGADLPITPGRREGCALR